MVRVIVFFTLFFSTSMVYSEQRVLVVSPHPDDDILGCGGSIAQHIQKKNLVQVVFMTSGERGNKKIDKKELAQLREKEAINAEKILGCSRCIFLRNPDGSLALHDQSVGQLEHIIEQLQPDSVYIPHAADSHKDHKMTYHIVVAALKKLLKEKKIKFPVVLCYEVWTPLQNYTYTENISEVMSLKLAALREHATQLQSLAYDDAVEALNRYRGIMSRKKYRYAECFYQLTESDMQDVD